MGLFLLTTQVESTLYSTGQAENTLLRKGSGGQAERKAVTCETVPSYV